MATVQEAVQKALEFSRATIGPEIAATGRLEEVETSWLDGDDTWLVTLSFRNPDPPEEPEPFSLTAPSRRSYKVFTISNTSGEVYSMKIREFANR